MLSTLENEKLYKEELKLGENIAKFMNNKEIIGIFTVNEESDFTKWVKMNFRGLRYNNARLFDPTDNGVEQDQDPTTYESILMIEIKFNQEENHIKTKRTSLIDFGYNKFIPVLHIIFEVDLQEDDKGIYQDERIRDGLTAWKIKNHIKF